MDLPVQYAFTIFLQSYRRYRRLNLHGITYDMLALSVTNNICSHDMPFVINLNSTPLKKPNMMCACVRVCIQETKAHSPYLK